MDRNEYSISYQHWDINPKNNKVIIKLILFVNKVITLFLINKHEVIDYLLIFVLNRLTSNKNPAAEL